METNPNPTKYLSTADVSRLLGVTPTMVRIYINKGDRGLKLRKLVRGCFAESDVLEFMAKREQQGKAKPGPKPKAVRE